MKKPYQIFFFEPGQDRYRLAEMGLDHPPQSIAVGDIVDGRYWPKEELGGRFPIFRVRTVAHQFFAHDDGTVQQFLSVYLDQLTSEEYEAEKFGKKMARGAV